NRMCVCSPCGCLRPRDTGPRRRTVIGRPPSVNCVYTFGEGSGMTARGDKPQGRDQIVTAVLDAAERLFVARGPSRVGLRDIAEEANVNVTLIYRHVGAKDDLLRAVADRLVRSGQEHIEQQSNWHDLVSLLFRETD